MCLNLNPLRVDLHYVRMYYKTSEHLAVNQTFSLNLFNMWYGTYVRSQYYQTKEINTFHFQYGV